MSEDLNINRAGSKEEQYDTLVPQIRALVELEPDLIANMANACAALKEQFGFLWIGFYIVKDGELVLGPFQGPVACTRIAKGRGVCGTSWAQKRTIIVPDVDAFPGHIACSSLSRSEIVIPVVYNDEVKAVMDIDSDQLSFFDETDEFYLGKIIDSLLHSFKDLNE
ncbi:MAG TPA: diguanylate cyclase [Sphingobacteriaceae bacterium]|nr:diguanylate cyclase [Sphingobacteriaceae bacterium]